jgi:MYXO-CTERM domain-containing protein
VRANGDLVAGTLTQGMQKSINNGDNWTDVAGAPHVNCLVENAAGEVWGCTQNYGSPQIPEDGFGIMKSTNLTTWTGILKYQEIYEPVACPMTTLQYMKCDKPNGAPGQPLGWCGLCAQLGCDPKRECPVDVDGAVDGKPGISDGRGCCDTGNGSGPTALAFGIAVGIVLLRRRRRT